MRAARRSTVGILAVLVLLGAGTIVPSTVAQGGAVGVAPSTLAFTDPPLQPGVAKTLKLHFQQLEWQDTVDAAVEVSPLDGAWGDASSWLTIVPGGDLRVPYTDDFPVNVSVSPPSTAANGLYKASVVFTAYAPDADAPEGSGAALPRSVTATVEIEVDNEHQVQRIEVTQSPTTFNAEEGGDFQFMIPLANTGNVDADPRVRVTIQDKFQEKTLVVRWFNGTMLHPGESRQVTYVWPGLDLPRDQYWAVIEVFLAGEQVGATYTKTFKVVEEGALLRMAELRTITVDGGSAFAEVGQLLKISAFVRNTGQSPFEAQFKGEVHRDGVLVDTIESSVLRVPIGEERALDMFYTAKEAGRHEFIGRVHYGDGDVTEKKSLIVTMDGGSFDMPWLWLGVGLAAVLVALGGFIVVRRRGQRPSPGAPVSRRAAPARPPKRGRPPAGRPPAGRPPAGARPRPPSGGPPQPRAGQRGPLPGGRGPQGAPRGPPPGR